MRSELIDREGVPLKVFSAGEDDLPTVLFASAVGMEGELLDRVAVEFLAAGLNLVTWELRGSPGLGDPPKITLHDHVADALAILHGLGVSRAHLAGWCTGASVALLLAREMGSRALSFTSVDGAYLFDGVPGAPMGNAVFDMCAEITLDTSRADFYYEVTRPRGNEAAVLGMTGEPELVRRLMMPYRQGAEGLIRYAFGIRAANAYDQVAACMPAGPLALFTARRDDQVVAFRNSARAAALMPGAAFHLAESGGHYAIFTDRVGMRRMAEFMLAAGGRDVA